MSDCEGVCGDWDELCVWQREDGGVVGAGAGGRGADGGGEGELPVLVGKWGVAGGGGEEEGQCEDVSGTLFWEEEVEQGFCRVFTADACETELRGGIRWLILVFIISGFYLVLRITIV